MKSTSREKQLVFTFFGTLWAAMFALAFVMKEHPVYSWDTSRSHKMTVKLLDALSESFFGFLNTIRSSLSGSYNAVGDLPPALWELLTGSTSRSHFIMALVIFYLAPLAFLLPRQAWRFFGGGPGEPPALPMILLAFGVFLYVPFWPSLLGGYTDLACLTPFLLALGLALSTDLTDGPKRRRMIMMGLCLYLCFLLRRWFIFAIGAFYLTYFIISLGRLKRDNLTDGLKSIIGNLLTAGLASLVPMMILQFPVLRGMVLNKYGEMYAAFQMPFSASLERIYSLTGPVILALAALSPVLAFIRREHAAANLFAVICPAIYILGFTRIQGLDLHHTLAVTFFIWLLAFGGVLALGRMLPGTFSRAALGLVLAALLALGFKGAFSPDPAAGAAAALGPDIRIRPVVHPGYEGLRGLVQRLEQLTAKSADKVAVLASTPDLNYDLVRNLMGPGFKNTVLTSKDIDQRDGISVFQLVAARFVVVPDPVHQQLPGSAQYVVTVPAGKILEGLGLGRAYARVGGYPVGNGVTGYIYEKTRPFTREEVEDYVRSFPAGSEKWPRPVTEDDKLLMTAENVISDGRERLPFDKENSRGLYVIKPGSNPPTSVTLNLDGLKRIKLAFSVNPRRVRCDGRAKVTVSRPGGPTEVVSLEKGETKEVELDLSVSTQATLSAERDSGTGCDFVLMRIVEKQ